MAERARVRWTRGALAALVVVAAVAVTLVAAPTADAGVTGAPGSIRGTAWRVDPSAPGGVSPLAGVEVEVYDFPSGESEAIPVQTGFDGTYEVTNVPPGTSIVLFRFDDGTFECYGGPLSGGSAANCESGGIVPVNVIEGVPTTGIDIVKDPTCEPSGPVHTGLTNMGFESGLSGWTTGLVTEGVTTTGADGFTSPFEGSSMARLGNTAPSAGTTQAPGPNTICQEFVVDQATERFAFNIFTYDYTGFDLFRFDLRVVDPNTGEIVGRLNQGAWGATGDTTLKSSGWLGAELDLAPYLGDTLRIEFSAGGTIDDLYAFWVYLDSADAGLPEPPVVVGGATSGSGSVMVDPVTGYVTVAQPASDRTDLTITTSVTCPSGAPTTVDLLLNGTSFAMTQTPPGSGTWTGTIPALALASGNLAVEAKCPTGLIVQTVGEVVLYDPSGYLTDYFTGEPIAGAEVTLHRVPGWQPADGPGPLGPNECESNLSKDPDDPWSQPAPTHLGVEENPLNGSIDPGVNPFISNADGYYGWDVAQGCWYVVVEAEGYRTLTSPVVGVPPEVTDLDLELIPEDLPTFGDVPESHLFWKDIIWMAVRDITQGYPNGNFGPNDPVTRGAFAAFGYRYLNGGAEPAPCTTAPFTDVPTTNVFCPQIAWMADEGLVGGFNDGTYRPGQPITRGAFAAILYRMDGSPNGPNPTCTTAPFPDVPTSNVFCGVIDWMVDNDITGGFNDGTFRPNDTITRAAMSAFLHRYDDTLEVE